MGNVSPKKLDRFSFPFLYIFGKVIYPRMPKIFTRNQNNKIPGRAMLNEFQKENERVDSKDMFDLWVSFMGVRMSRKNVRFRNSYNEILV